MACNLLDSSLMMSVLEKKMGSKRARVSRRNQGQLQSPTFPPPRHREIAQPPSPSVAQASSRFCTSCHSQSSNSCGASISFHHPLTVTESDMEAMKMHDWIQIRVLSRESKPLDQPQGKHKVLIYLLRGFVEVCSQPYGVRVTDFTTHGRRIHIPRCQCSWNIESYNFIVRSTLLLLCLGPSRKSAWELGPFRLQSRTSSLATWPRFCLWRSAPPLVSS